jgi:hypothetical protein
MCCQLLRKDRADLRGESGGLTSPPHRGAVLAFGGLLIVVRLLELSTENERSRTLIPGSSPSRSDKERAVDTFDVLFERESAENNSA